MSSEAKQIKYCKCGHTRTLHKKNPKSRWQNPRICNNCPCSKYLNRNRPDKLDKLGAMLGPLTAILFTILVIYTISLQYYSVTEEERNAPVNLDITNGEFHFILYLMLVLVVLWFGDILFTPLEIYLKNRKRRNWPIENPVTDIPKDTLESGK